MTWKEKNLNALVAAVLTFLSVLGAALLGHFSKTRLPSQHRQDDTTIVVGLVGNLFVVTTSVFLGLMLNSAKNTSKPTTVTFVRWRRNSSCWIEPCEDWARKPRTPVGIWLNTSRPL